jgi:hypothetical protein
MCASSHTLFRPQRGTKCGPAPTPSAEPKQFCSGNLAWLGTCAGQPTTSKEGVLAVTTSLKGRQVGDLTTLPKLGNVSMGGQFAPLYRREPRILGALARTLAVKCPRVGVQKIRRRGCLLRAWGHALSAASQSATISLTLMARTLMASSKNAGRTYRTACCGFFPRSGQIDSGGLYLPRDSRAALQSCEHPTARTSPPYGIGRRWECRGGRANR